MRHFYEKDELISVDPNRVPKLDIQKVCKFPVGYRYLGYCQEMKIGVKVIRDLPGHRREIDTANREKRDILYRQIKAWMDGEMIDV